MPDIANVRKQNITNAAKNRNNNQGTTPSQNSDEETVDSSSGSGIVSFDDATGEVLSGSDGSNGSSGSDDGSSGSSGTSPLLEGNETFEEMIGDICNGIDLIFAVKRSTVVVTDYEGIYAEAKYLRDLKHESIKGEDINLWQLEEGTYELEVSEYGFYNTVKVHYKDGVITESYEDLVRVYGECTIDYYEDIDKTSAIMKAKAYLAAHVREFDMAVKANLLWDGNIDVGDIVTIENPLTMRDKYRVETENRDPEYYFVMGTSIEWEEGMPITGTLELRYGAKSPESKEVPESGTQYSSSGDVEKALKAVGDAYHSFGYCHSCQTADCTRQQKCGDCWGMSDLIACELVSRGVEAKIVQYAAIASNHRSVLYKDKNGQWQDFPYREYGFNQLFNNTSGSKNGTEINKTCG